MDDETKNKAKGKGNQAMGGIREKAGEATGNEEMESKGRGQQMKGDSQETLGKAQGAMKDAAGAAKDAAGTAADKIKEATRQ